MKITPVCLTKQHPCFPHSFLLFFFFFFMILFIYLFPSLEELVEVISEFERLQGNRCPNTLRFFSPSAEAYAQDHRQATTHGIKNTKHLVNISQMPLGGFFSPATEFFFFSPMTEYFFFSSADFYFNFSPSTDLFSLPLFFSSFFPLL